MLYLDCEHSAVFGHGLVDLSQRSGSDRFPFERGEELLWVLAEIFLYGLCYAIEIGDGAGGEHGCLHESYLE